MSFEPASHTLLTHENCNISGCAICEKTVKICLTCGGVETTARGSGLTTQCLEKPLSEEQKIAISSGDLDYKNFRWYDKRLGPTIEEKLKEGKGKDIKLGSLFHHLIKEEGQYICVGVYKNKNEQIMYCFHQVMTYGNRATAGFVTMIHYAKFLEMFGDL